MARLNITNRNYVVPGAPVTHEGARAKRIIPEAQLLRSVMACLLWEDSFYEDGVSIADRIKDGVAKVSPEFASFVAIQARTEMNLRHVPLLIAREMARLPKHKCLVKATLSKIINRADELAEFLMIYWKGKKQPLSAQVKKGLAAAFTKFDAYALAKYNRDNIVRLKDVLFLCHAKPKDPEQAIIWKALIDDKLPIPDTWEVALSASKGENKKAVWERLLREDRIPSFALIRNLRNFIQNNVDESLVIEKLSNINTEKLFPYRFIAAAKYAPQWESYIEHKFFESCQKYIDGFKGRTAILVDVSGSMDSAISNKSEMKRMDAACGLAMIMREVCHETVSVYAFSHECKLVPARRGFALRDAIVGSMEHGSTYLGNAISEINRKEDYERLIVITDEQSNDDVGNPKANTNGYMINVAADKNGVGYGRLWNHIDGFSEAIVKYIYELEKSINEE